jgi:hypothetical protein
VVKVPHGLTRNRCTIDLNFRQILWPVTTATSSTCGHIEAYSSGLTIQGCPFKTKKRGLCVLTSMNILCVLGFYCFSRLGSEPSILVYFYLTLPPSYSGSPRRPLSKSRDISIIYLSTKNIKKTFFQRVQKYHFLSFFNKVTSDCYLRMLRQLVK